MNNRQQAKQDPNKITAVYQRLSQEDESQGESNSIRNQRKLLEDYAVKNGFSNIVHYSDDGYSGTNFDRPSWKRMISEVEAGKVAAVIVKDMSRVGRDYLQVGFYTEVLFREKGVRFIAVSNNIDSADAQSNEMAPFLNIMAEWYARDNSRKISTVMRAKGKEGKRLTSHAIYGYMNDPADKEKWLIDEEAAEVVRRIFRLTIEGKGPEMIARIFTGEEIQRPSYYQAMHGRGANKNNYSKNTPYTWSGSTISNIISKQEYIGHTVNFRFYKDSYKDKNCKKAEPENWMIFENTHPAIVDAETFETAQNCRKTKRRYNDLGEANPLTGKMLCAECGARMYNHRKPYVTPHYNYQGTGITRTRAPSDTYTCSAFTLARQHFKPVCSLHNIRTVVVKELVLDAIKAAAHDVKKNEAKFIQKLREASVLRKNENMKSHKRRLDKEKRRISDLDMLVKKLFEEHALGNLPDKRFEILSADYEKEQAALEQSSAVLQAELESFDEDSQRADKFIELVKKYTEFPELTPVMINEFVDKILVFEADKSTGERLQRVDVYLNFIGKVELPVVEYTAEELEEQAKKKHKQAKRREYEARYRAKKKAKRLEQELFAQEGQAKTA